MELAQKLHESLRARLIATGKTQAEIGYSTGLAQSTIGRFLRGLNDISLSNYAKLCAMCDEHEALAKNNENTQEISALA